MKAVSIIPVMAALIWTFSATVANAAMRKTLTPRISIQEQYDDNIDLEPENEDSDWITVASPGISLSLDTLKTTMNLDYEAGFSFYQDDSSRNSTRHQGRIQWDQDLTRLLSLEVNDTFVRSEDPIVETDGQIEDIRRERSTYYRNTGEASLSCKFGAEDLISAGYRNRYLDDTSSRNEDSLGHEGFLSLDNWFTPRFGIGMTSRYNRGQFEEADDFDQYGAGLTVNYRWQPSRRVYTRYDFLYHDIEEAAFGNQGNDYRVHQGALGLSVGLGPHSEFSAEGGYFLQDYLNGDQTEGPAFSAGVSTRSQKTSLRLAGSGGYEESYFSSENLGSSKYSQVLGSADYLLTEDLRLLASGSYRWQEFFGADIERDRKDEVWRARAGCSLSFWRWLSLSLEATHSERQSTDPTVEFRDNRVMLRLTGEYPVTF